MRKVRKMVTVGRGNMKGNTCIKQLYEAILDERTKDVLQADKSDIEELNRQTALYNLDVGDEVRKKLKEANEQWRKTAFKEFCKKYATNTSN